MGYGLAVFGNRFTMTAEADLGFSTTGRDYSLGWRLTPEGQRAGSLALSVEARRHANDNAVAGFGSAEHALGLRLTARF